MSTPDTQTAVAARAVVSRLAQHFALPALQAQLPLRFPAAAPSAVPATFRALSCYTYPGWERLAHGETLSTETELYLALHLIDLSPLRGELVRLTGIGVNAPGQTPFDPVSLFLCCLLYRETKKSWHKLAKALRGSWGVPWRPLLGFTADATPGASTMRTFYHALGKAFGTSLCPRFIQLLADAELLPPHDPDSSVPARDGLPLATDGQLHEAHTSERCAQVTTSCYQPLLPGQSRPCPARDQGHDGCACDTDACTRACRYTTPRDAEARHIHYSGHNQHDETDKQRGRDVYGYRSYAHTLVDDDLHTYWVAYTSVHPATTDERVIFPHDFAQLQAQLPQLPISELVADAALGYTPCLDVIYDAQAIPIVYIRHAPSDSDAAACQLRGYDPAGVRSVRTVIPWRSMASTTRACAPVGSVTRSAPVPPTPRSAIARFVTPSVPWGWSNTSSAPLPILTAPATRDWHACSRSMHPPGKRATLAVAMPPRAATPNSNTSASRAFALMVLTAPAMTSSSPTYSSTCATSCAWFSRPRPK